MQSPITIRTDSGNHDYLVRRIERNTIPFGSQLVINETQEALIIYSGKLLSKLSPGTYTLDTALIPGIKNSLPGGDQSLTCDIWFINKTVNNNYNWGTQSPVQVQDPKYNLLLPVGAYGCFEAYIEDFERFFRQSIGTKYLYTIEDLTNLILPIIQREIKDYIGNVVLKEGVFSLSTKLNEASSYILLKIKNKSEEFGINIRDFYIKDISVVGNDPSFQEVKAALSKGAKTKIESMSIEESAEGYKTQRSFDVLEKLADGIGNGNDGGAGIAPLLANAGIGLGAGIQFGNAIGNVQKEVMGNNTNEKKSGLELLKELKILLDEGVITQEDYNNKKDEILGSL